jgi:hypothetical protein
MVAHVAIFIDDPTPFNLELEKQDIQNNRLGDKPLCKSSQYFLVY